MMLGKGVHRGPVRAYTAGSLAERGNAMVRIGWSASAAVSLLLAALLIGLWHQADRRYDPNPGELTNAAAVEASLARRGRGGARLRIPTGVFVESLKFVASSEVDVSGYIWQRYPAGMSSGPTRGFFLPDQVGSSDAVVQVVLRKPLGDAELVLWYFEATLRQPFDYRHYPLDHKTVWVRLRPADFTADVDLTPDLAAYRSTGLRDVFGLEPNIVLGGWDIVESFFDYRVPDYDTDFGLGEAAPSQRPDLYFNVVVKRRFVNAFIIYLVPLLTVAVLLFATLMLVTPDRDRADRLGFSAAGALGVCSGLFFVVLLSHVQLREQHAGSGVVYLERFYLVIYAVIALVAANSYLVSVGSRAFGGRLLHRDNLPVKLAFWPVLLGVGVVITYLSLF
jgi:hypothetical protein